MSARLTTLLALYLIVLNPTVLRAEVPRFARGFVIYKKVPSDQPRHYGGSLYLGSDHGPVWYEYDIGQPRPFYLARDLFVSEIKFGTLFEADFTTPQHVAYCRSVQAQLTAAAQQSPLLASAATAAVKAIQAEVDHYEKGSVRLRGTWTDRTQYEATLAAKDQAMQAQASARQTEAEQLRKNQAETAAANKIRQDNLTHAYPATAAQYLLQQDNFAAIIAETHAAVKARRSLPPLLPPWDDPTLIQLPQSPDAIPLLWQASPGSSETSSAMLCTYDGTGQPILADLVLYLISDPDRQTLLNPAEIAPLRTLLNKIDPEILNSLPDVLAATRIKAVLKDQVATTKLVTTHLIRPKYHVYYSIDVPVEYQQTKQQQFILIQIRPAS